ncbi:50S ribosomal protein L19, chloroplastic [Triticum urartu]|uniref:50S ribosomal protein L19, chloroplastic n=1 Tax=Triticum urartu TaxID=4572 RepID=M7ZW58_TRIUA|nr:50S ribosomal protein L19, chloroplastic [Triticum urartu]
MAPQAPANGKERTENRETGQFLPPSWVAVSRWAWAGSSPDNRFISCHGVTASSGFCAEVLMPRGLSTVGSAEVASDEDDSSSPAVEHPPRIKFKRPDKTARHIMNILNKEAVDKQVPENKRRESTLKGIVIARRNAGINTTFRLRRLVAGVGVESVFPLYSPNIKEMKILDRKKVRRAKLYYLRDRMNALRK